MMDSDLTASQTTLNGNYDVILTRGTPRVRQSHEAIARAKLLAGQARKTKASIKIITFLAGLQTGFGLGSGLRAAGITSGLARAAITAGVAYTAYRVGQETTGGEGRFASGVSAGAALFSAYEGWTLLEKMEKLYKAVKTAPRWTIVGLGPVGGTFNSGLWWMPWW